MDVPLDEFRIARSACGVSVVLSSSELLDGVVSEPEETLAALIRSPVALGEMVAISVYSIEPPSGISTVSEIFPVPELVKLALVEPVAVQVADANDDGKVSVIVAPVTEDGP